MQFHEGAETACAHRFIASISDPLEGLPNADAGRVSSSQDVFGGVVAGIGCRCHGRRRKARTFLVGPIDNTDRGFRLDPRIVERAHDFQRRQCTEHAIELAAGGLGVEMRAEPDGRFRHIAALA